MRKVDTCLDSPLFKGYFVGGHVDRTEVLRALAEDRIFDQATALASYSNYRRASQSQRRGIRAIILANPDLESLLEQWLNDAEEVVIIDNAVETINLLLGTERDKLLVELDSEGLRRLQDPVYRVPTSSLRSLQSVLSRMDGGSIALAGPRGAGKSTLLRYFSQLPGDRMISTDGIAVYVPAPAEYVAREFLADLFQRLCEAYLQYSQIDAIATSPDTDIRGKIRRQARLILLVARTLVVAIIICWIGLSVGGQGLTATFHSVIHVHLISRTWWSHNRGYVWAIIVISALACSPSPRSWRLALRSDAEPGLTTRARDYLQRLRIDKTITTNSNFASPLIRGFMFAVGRGTSVRFVPWTMPEMVGHARQFIADVSSELRSLNRTITIGIDEIDRIGSAEQAERFIGEIKTIFGIEGCFFLVAVAEDVGSLFKQRATAGRSILENAFDEIVTVLPLDLGETRHLLRRRVLGFTDPFVCLVHAFSGGLPREVIRTSRRLIEINSRRTSAVGYPKLDYLALALAVDAVAETLDAMRKEMSNLTLGPAWADFLGQMRLLSGMLRRGDAGPTEWYSTIRSISEIEIEGDAGGEDERVARMLMSQLSTFALFCSTIVDAFSVLTVTVSNDFYEELASARVELAASTNASRHIIRRMRTSYHMGE